MSWFRKSVRQRGEKPQEAVTFPHSIGIVPEELGATVYLHDLETKSGLIHCWTYISRGMLAHRQKDLALTLQRLPGEDPADFPAVPLEFFKGVYDLVKQGRIVDEGAYTEFSDDAFLGARGFTYASLDRFSDINWPDLGLAAIALKGLEVETVKRHGSARVLSQLGRIQRHFPYPTWYDRSRGPLPVDPIQDTSILNLTHLIQAGPACIFKRGDVIALQLSHATGDRLLNALESLTDNRAFAVLTQHDPLDDATLTWLPNDGAAAIGPDGTEANRISGSFVFISAVGDNNFAKMLEDGFHVSLDTTSFNEFRNALDSKRTIRIPADIDGFDFELVWLQTAYRNPLDGILYRNPFGWSRYSPESDHTAGEGPDHVARLLSTVLLTPEQLITERLNGEQFEVYIRQIQDTVIGHFDGLTPNQGMDLLIHVDLYAEHGKRIGIFTSPKVEDVEQHWLNLKKAELDSSLDELRAPTLSDGSVRLQVLVELLGGDSQPKRLFAHIWP